MIKTLFFTSVLLFTYFITFSQNSERAKIDITNYRIKLKIPDTETAFIQGNTEINLVLKKDSLKTISLDLSDLTVDSLFLNSEIIKNFIRKKETIEIPLSKFYFKNDSAEIIIFYRGKPAQDPRWGGFYFTKNTAFNMGVGMKSNPQVFGRCWFPCNDTLSDKATYQFEISVNNGLQAVCSGILDSVKNENQNTAIYYWSQKLPISTYLASVSVGNYKLTETTFIGIEKEIQIQWYIKANQKDAAKKSFIHTNNAVEIFEKYYGPYAWNRVGFVSVPFNAGAMEHAENIALPDYAVNGTLSNESLWVHELSHSWFGNLVTCEKSEDMWLNEGWATYSEALFVQKNYGESAYKDYVRHNHRNVLTKTHIYDDRFRAVYGNTGDYTYGSTVYDKGADVVHCLRNYLGDSVFFSATREYLKKYAFSTASTENFIAVFEEISKKDLGNFFENWIYKPGFPHFKAKLSSITKKENGFFTKITVNQNFVGRDFYSKENLIDLTFFDKELNEFTVKAEISGKSTIVSAEVPFKPVCVLLDKDEKVSDATIDNYTKLSKPETAEFPDVDFKIKVSEFKAIALIQAVLNIISPEKSNSENYILSKICYWTISGFAENLKAEGIFGVDKSLHGFSCEAEKLCLLFRPNSKSEWQPVKFSFSEKDSKTVEITVPNFKFGEYVVAEKK
jgi:aminopeptidase N